VVDFIEYYPSALVLVVRKASEDAVVSGNGILDSFHRTFIAEGRYRMFLSGLLVTVFMAVSAGVLGTLLAFALVFLKHRDHPITNRIIGVYRSLIAGIPSVIILMVLYYLIFGAVQIPAVIVAIVGFSLIFGGRAYQIIWNAVNAVDAGQREAALALGYSEKKAFREVILPQSSGIYKPLLQAQYVMLLKETSIAGFITVLELTRVGDLIRSRTMEAFFPLIVVAAIYFLLTRLLTFIATG
jgi:polar amino acid transport system substrate-binding protein